MEKIIDSEINSKKPSESQIQVEQQKALTSVITKIRKYLDLETIFQTTVTEVRQLLRADRVGVFRFYPELDWEGEFVFEDVEEKWTSALKVKVRDHCFSERFAPLYRQGRVNAISDIYQGGYQQCYLDILQQFQVRANVVAPLLKGDFLWGLLCIHQCGIPRNWQESEVEFVAQIAENLSVALQHNESLTQARYQTEQQKALAGVIARIRESLDLETIFQTTVTEVRNLLKADRVGVFRFDPSLDWEGEFVFEDVLEPWNSTISTKVHDYCFSENFVTLYQQGRVNGISDIYQDCYEECYVKILEQFQVRANLVAPLLRGKELWGLLCIHQCSAPRNWSESETEFVTQIAEQLSVALKQAEYIEQVHTQATQLALVKEQERAAQWHKALFSTVDKIRQSLELETIFEVSTEEVRQLIKSDRVAIYRFHDDWSGDFVAESIAPGWTPLVGVDPIFTDTVLQESKGGRYANNETFAVDNIYQAGYTECHIALLEQFEAKAYIIAPIFQGEKLWGLLAAYQNSSARHWQEHEIYLLSQIGSQLGVALQQAEYLKQVKSQAAQLARATQLQKALANTVDKIRQSLDLETIFRTTTKEVRQLLKVERVAIYRFHADWGGEFVADSIVDAGKIASLSEIADAPDDLLKIVPGQYPRNESFVPILQGEKLWGLLVASQNSQPRYWQEEEINLLAQVGIQLGIAIQQAELLKTTRQQTAKLNQAIENLKQTQTQLIQGEKMAGLGQLVAGIAHEINNPVNFIYGNLAHVSDYTQDLLDLIKLYQQHYPHPEAAIQEEAKDIELDFIIQDLPKTLSSMKIGADRIRKIVLSLRTFSRLDEAQMKPVDLHQGIDSTLLILQHRLKAKPDRLGIKVVKNYGSLPLVECYAAQMNQVFMNILANAIDALEETKEQRKSIPQIQICTQLVEPDSVAVIISDNGSGIPETVRSQIFDPFFTTKQVGKGTGLGLSISFQIVVEKHGGELTCTSKPGQGSEFRIKIPLQSSQNLSEQLL